MAAKKSDLTTSPHNPVEDKKKALETAMAQIERAYGKGSIMRLGENTDITVEAIPTGSLALDIALGIGGVPKGRIVESMVPNPPARQPWPCTSWLKPRSWVGKWPSSTLSMPWIPPMPRPWE